LREVQNENDRAGDTVTIHLKERIDDRGLSQRNPALKQLEVFVGQWEFASPQFSNARGLFTFDWVEGGAFLVERMGDSATLLWKQG
jgi:hypothetical protein